MIAEKGVKAVLTGNLNYYSFVVKSLFMFSPA